MPDWSTRHKRLQWAREKAGYAEAVQAADAMNIERPTYYGHENGSRGLSRAASRYARFFRVSLDWLMENRGDPRPPARRDRPEPPSLLEVPLLEWVSAGRLAAPASQIPIEDVPLLAFTDLGRGDFFALRVDGDSMNRVSPDGSIIVVNKADRTLVPDKCYVFSVKGEVTYKLWNAEPVYLAPFSTNESNKPIFIKQKRDLEVIGRVRRTILDL